MVLAVAFIVLNGLQVQSCSLSGPDEFKTSFLAMLKSSGGSDRPDYDGNYELWKIRPEIYLASVLNWIETSGWTMVHMTSNDVLSKCIYTFRRNE
jgi:hypothetical protein